MEEVTGLECFALTELDPVVSDRLVRLLDVSNRMLVSIEAATGAVVVSALSNAGAVEEPKDHYNSLREAKSMAARSGLLLSVIIEELEDCIEAYQRKPERPATEAASCTWPPLRTPPR